MSTDKQKVMFKLYSLSEGKANLFKGLCGGEWQTFRSGLSPNECFTLLLHITDSFHSPDCMQTMVYDPDIADTRRLFSKIVHHHCYSSQLDIRLAFLLVVLASA